ncbi:MAG: tetratricopeptide repeat protein [bacterium]|nr:tetratricopeptide repeat protein [bacterium]
MPLRPRWGGAAKEKAKEEGKEKGKKEISEADELEGSPLLLFRIALRYHQRGLYVRGHPLLQRFVQKYPNHSEHGRAAYMLADASFFIAKTGVPAAFRDSVLAYRYALDRYPQMPQMPTAFFRLGQSYQELGQAPEGQVAFRAILERAPLSSLAPRAQLEIGHYYIKSGDPRSAIVEYQKILDNYKGKPEEKEAFFGIANAIYAQGRFQEAATRFETGIKRWPDFVNLRSDLLFNYGESLFQIRRFQDAGRVYLQMVNIYPTSDSAHRAMTRLGDIFLEEGRTIDALKVYARVIQDYPRTESHLVALIRMADIGLEKKDIAVTGVIFDMSPFREPLRAYREVIRLGKDTQFAEVAYLRLGAHFLKVNLLREAIATMREFIEKYASSQLLNNGHVIVARAKFKEIDRYFRRREFLRAINAYAEFRAIVPLRVTPLAQPYQAMLQVGESYMRLGFYPDAVKILTQIMEEPEGAVTVGETALLRLTQSALEQGQRKRAKELGTAYLKRFQQSVWTPTIQSILGEIALLEGQPRTADRRLRAALEGRLADEIRSRAFFMLSDASIRLGRYDQAVESLQKAMAIHQTISSKIKPFSLEQANFRLGDILYDGRRLVSALLAYRRALEAYPKSTHAGWALHRIARIQDRLRIAKQADSRPLAKVRELDDPFWRDVSRLRSESKNWDEKNRPRIDSILRQKSDGATN